MYCKTNIIFLSWSSYNSMEMLLYVSEILLLLCVKTVTETQLVCESCLEHQFSFAD